MADFTYAGVVGGAEPEHRRFDVAAGAAASIAIGDIAVVANGFAAGVVDGGAAAGNLLLGLAVSTSTDTVAAAGVVDLVYHPNGLVVRGLATTAANLTAGVLFDKVTVDVAAGVQTIDENDAGAILIYRYPTTTPTTDAIVEAVLPWTLAS